MKVLSLVLAGIYIVSATGCTALVQVPRSQFAAQPERRNLVVRTDTGQQYAFERATVTPDSLEGFGYQQRLVQLPSGESSVDEVALKVSLPLDSVTSLQVRQRDWGRTTKWGIGVLGAAGFVIAVGTRGGDKTPAQPGGGKGPPEL